MNDNPHGSTTIFLWNGFQDTFSSLSIPEQNKLIDHFEGQLGMAGYVASFASCVDKYNEERSEDDEYPGVFDYEVTEPMGQWLCNNPGATQKAFLEELKRFYGEWIGDAAAEAAGEEYFALPLCRSSDGQQYLRCAEERVEVWGVYRRNYNKGDEPVALFHDQEEAEFFVEARSFWEDDSTVHIVNIPIV